MIFLLFLLFLDVKGQNFACPGDLVLNTALGDSACNFGDNPYAQCGGIVQQNTTCTFNIYPQNDDSFSMVLLQVISRDLNSDDRILIQTVYDSIQTDPNSQTFIVQNAFPFPQNNISPIMTITITAGPFSLMKFGYYLTRQNVIFSQNPIPLANVGSGQLAQIVRLAGTQPGDFWEVNGTSQVTFSAALDNFNDPMDFLNVWYYDGIGANRKLMGSLYTAIQSTGSRQMVSSLSNSATLQYVFSNYRRDNLVVLINDKQNLDFCDFYRLNWVSNDNTSMPLGSIDGPPSNTICYTLVNYPIPAPNYFYGLQTTNISTLQLLSGGPTTDPIGTNSLLATYFFNQSNPIESNPPLLTSAVTTFIISSSGSLITTLFYSAHHPDKIHEATPGKSGFLSTPDYPYSALYQNLFFYVNNSVNFNFNLQIQKSLSSTAYLTVFGANGKLLEANATTGFNVTFNDKVIDFDIQDPESSGGVFLTYQITAAPFVCPNGSSLLQDSYNQDVLALPSNFECSFTYTYMENSFAEVIVQAQNIADGEIVQILGVFDTVGNLPNMTYYYLDAAFPPSQVAIYVKTGNSTNMKINYSLNKLPFQMAAPTAVNLPSLADAFYLQLQTVGPNRTWEITSNSKVVAISASPPESPSTNLLNYFVYDGIGKVKVLIGTLYSSYQRGWISPSSSITVYLTIYGDPNVPNEGTILFNDNLNLDGCQIYTAQWSYGNPTKTFFLPNGGNITVDTIIDATNGTACLTIIDDDFSQFDNPIFYQSSVEGNPFVISGAPITQAANNTLRNLGSLISGGYNYFDLPQALQGSSRTIYQDKGVTMLATTINPNDANLSQVFIGRQGFIMSANYPFVNYAQDAHFTLQGTFNFTLQFNIQYTDAPSDASLTIFTRNGVHSIVNISDPNATKQNFTASGDLVIFTLDGGSNLEYNKGSYIRYTVTGQEFTTQLPPITSTTSSSTTSTTQRSSSTTTPTVSPTTTPKASSIISGLNAVLICLFVR